MLLFSQECINSIIITYLKNTKNILFTCNSYSYYRLFTIPSLYLMLTCNSSNRRMTYKSRNIDDS